jgi:hypothetical protein
LYIGVEMRGLPGGVNSCVGSAGAGESHRMLMQFLQSPFDRSLNRALSRLTLPSGKVGAVIGQQKPDIPGSFFFVHPGLLIVFV